MPADIRIIVINDRKIGLFLIFEDPHFCLIIRFGVRIAVQVIFSQINQRCDVRAKFIDGFKLKTWNFNHVVVSRIRIVAELDEWNPYVAADKRLFSTFFQQSACKLSCSRFAIRSGYANERAFQVVKRQFKFWNDRDLFFASCY